MLQATDEVINDETKAAFGQAAAFNDRVSIDIPKEKTPSPGIKQRKKSVIFDEYVTRFDILDTAVAGDDNDNKETTSDT